MSNPLRWIKTFFQNTTKLSFTYKLLLHITFFSSFIYSTPTFNIVAHRHFPKTTLKAVLDTAELLATLVMSASPGSEARESGLIPALIFHNYNFQEEKEKILSSSKLKKKHEWITIFLFNDMISEIEPITWSQLKSTESRIWNHYYNKAQFYAKRYNPRIQPSEWNHPGFHSMYIYQAEDFPFFIHPERENGNTARTGSSLPRITGKIRGIASSCKSILTRKNQTALLSSK